MARSIRGRKGALFLVSLSITAGTAFISAPAHAAVSFRDSASAHNTGALSSLVIAKPTDVVEGDVMVAQVTSRGGGNVVLTPPTGWALERRTDRAAELQQSIYWKAATASEPTDYTWSFGQNRKASGGIVAYEGVDPGSPIEASSGGHGDSSTLTAPSVTTVGSDDLLLAFFGVREDHSGGVSQPTGMAEKYDTLDAGDDVASSANDETLTSSGATGSRVATYAESHPWIAQLVALRPAGASCTKTAATLDIVLTPSGNVSIGRSGIDFVVTGEGIADTTCGGATVHNIDTVNVTSGSGVGGNVITIDTSGGAFEPGVTDEGAGKTSEIEFNINSGAGTDRLVVQGGSSNDFFDVTPSGAKLNNDTDVDVANTDVESVELRGGDGADTLRGRPTSDSMFGEGGEDTLIGGKGTDSLDGGPDNDVVTGGAANDTLFGGGGHDSLLGRQGPDDLNGDAGNDSLSPGGGVFNDALDGGADRDTVDYARTAVSGASTGVTVDLRTVGDGSIGGSGDQNTVAAGSDDLVGIESLRGSFYDDTLTGDEADNFIFGWGGADVISGLGGSDALSGGDGDDSLSGGDGSDVFHGGNGTDTCDGGDDIDDFASDEGTCETELNAP